ncbi:ATP-binding protein [Alteromonas sp. CYL-A6]|uniref:ATP-binding protein n=1 Tax=Alteromonas nitratireducens TaxID=3390813 RepID=UPI0034B4173C
MKQLSLRTRSVLLALLALALFIPVTVFTLDNAYTSSLKQAKLSELRLMSLALVAAFELDGEVPVMPELLYEEQLNLPDSGYVGMIVFRDKVVWQSASALNVDMSSPPAAPKVGQEAFLDNVRPNFDNSHQYFSYVFTAEFASEDDFEPVHFYVLNDKTAFLSERSAFLNTVWKGMLMLAAGLLLLLLVGMNIILLPVRKLISEIKHTARGGQAQISEHYPPEFDGLKGSINHLIRTESQQRERYKNSLGDLAHSLKTPLAVALGASPLSAEARDALLQIDALIQRQLKRASAGQTGWQTATPVRPVLEKLISAMNKIYQDRGLTLSLTCEPDTRFWGDQTDLMEMLGNLLDNACKAASSQVKIHVSEDDSWLVLRIEDDGPGISDEHKSRLLERGTRLDTYAEGQGIGMAVVSDLVGIYGGQLDIQQAPSGGAIIDIRLPASGQTSSLLFSR